MQLVLKSRTIRPWRLDDAESLAKHANNRKIWLGLRDLFPIHTRVMTRTNFCKNKFLYRSGGPGYRGDRHSPRAECASAYGDAWLLVRRGLLGRGIMTEAVAAFTDFCFENFPLRRISAEVFANNLASARVLEKAGFVFEGCLKNNVIKDGKLLDSLLYAKTR